MVREKASECEELELELEVQLSRSATAYSFDHFTNSNSTHFFSAEYTSRMFK